MGSRALPEDWVLVHDAARPCLSKADLQHLLDRLGTHRVGGLLATPAADTLKRANLEQRPSTGPRASAEPPASAASRPTPEQRADSRTSAEPRQTPDQRVGTGPLHTSGSDPEVAQTVDRAGLWRALTPQMFRYEMLCDALDRSLAANRLPTDEAQALEWTGEHPVLVQGSAANIKITSADDLVLAAALLSARESTAVGS